MISNCKNRNSWTCAATITSLQYCRQLCVAAGEEKESATETHVLGISKKEPLVRRFAPSYSAARVQRKRTNYTNYIHVADTFH